MNPLEPYRHAFEEYLKGYEWMQHPTRLYEPLQYFMSIRGKRIRPSLTLLACDMYSGDYSPALPASMSVELFHNFSLIHDDIMDEAQLRRGYTTVHVKYSPNQAILSGDVMLILAYQHLEHIQPANIFRKILQIFNQTARQVCEGQQMDIDFENRLDVQRDEYLLMIKNKTAVLLGAALVIGALIGGADQREIQHLYELGIALGMAFQIRDDLLDVFGQSQRTGKVTAGDIAQNKKTLLYILARDHASPQDKKQLLHWYTLPSKTPDQIEAVRQLFRQYHVDTLCESLLLDYYHRARSAIDKLHIPAQYKAVLQNTAKALINRDF